MVLPLPGQGDRKARAKSVAVGLSGDNFRVYNNLQDLTNMERRRPRTFRCEACSKSSVADGYRRALFGECLSGVDAAAGDDLSVERIDLIGRREQPFAKCFDSDVGVGGDH